MFKQLSIFSIIISFLLSCTTSPLGRKQLMLLPDEQINAMGVEAFDTIKEETAVAQDSTVNRYVTCITEALLQTFETQNQQWEVTVFESDDVNAFALPGGKVGVYTGLLDVTENQDQLAAVIAHEIAHVLSNHGNERVSQEFAVQSGLDLIQAITNVQTSTGKTLMGLLGVGVQVGVLLPYSRIQESESDLLGLELMARAGFQPQASIALWQNMEQTHEEQPPEFLSTHPSHTTRMNDLNTAMPHALQLYQQAQAAGRKPQCHHL